MLVFLLAWLIIVAVSITGLAGILTIEGHIKWRLPRPVRGTVDVSREGLPVGQ